MAVSDASGGVFPKTNLSGPLDIHVTAFYALGISPRAEIRDMLGSPVPVSGGVATPAMTGSVIPAVLTGICAVDVRGISIMDHRIH
ncbi:MAG: hypothetical protein JWM11_2746 [Planctomycetaceae bacterium]|nr:hypothetical protein [Planctomycetaceae bacterium]